MRRREFLIVGLALPAFAVPNTDNQAATTIDAIVNHRHSAIGRQPVFGSIAAALAAAPEDSASPWRIQIDGGTWFEKLVVDKPNIHLLGRGRGRSIIRFDAAAGQRDPTGELWGTWGCASIRVTAPGFAATDLTILNGFDYLDHLRDPKLESIGSNGPQAVALMLDEGSDLARLERCTIGGHQDTLFVDAGRSRFRQCDILGSVDFIFGAGRSLFEDCDIISRYRPGKARQGYIAAPSTRLTDRFGLVFRHCRVRCDAEIPAGSVALGRAWRPTREFPDGRYGDPDAVGSAAFIECEMAGHITSEGWDAMKYTARDGERVELRPDQARFCEYANHGAGARLHPDRPQLSAQQARTYVAEDWFASTSGDSGT